jgi:hypothetical protein
MAILAGEVCCKTETKMALTMSSLFYEIYLMDEDCSITNVFLIAKEDVGKNRTPGEDYEYNLLISQEPGEPAVYEDLNGNKINPGLWVFIFIVYDCGLQKELETILSGLKTKSLIHSFVLEKEVPSHIVEMN